MQTIAIINQKGGCGKTTTAISLAGVFARQDRRALLVDLDPQSHCAAGLSIPEARIELDIGDALLADEDRGIDATRLIWRACRNLDLIPSRTRLAGLEAAKGGLADRPNREFRLRKALERYWENYDLALLDCPPSIGLLTFNALAAADAVLIPVETSYFALQGASKQVATIRSLSKRLAEPPAYWLVATIHDESNAVSRDILDELGRKFGKRLAPVVIRHDAKLREAASFGQAIPEFAPESRGAADYGELARWLSETLAVASKSRPRVPERVFAGQDEEFARVTVSTHAGVEGELARRLSPQVEPAAGAGGGTLRGRAVALAEPERSSPAEPEAPDPIGRARDLAERARRFAARSATRAAAMPTHLLGVRATRRGLLFVQPLAAGSRVSIAGDFNGWNPGAGEMTRNEELGVHEVCIPAGKGRHAYRLVVDGRWSPDPYNDATEPNPFGEFNSIATVP